MSDSKRIDGTVNDTALKGFNAGAADTYERARPEYTREAVAHMAEVLGAALCPADKHVLEIGAGTGKFTRSLLRHVVPGRLVVVEPADMRVLLSKWLPQEAVLICPAEDIPLPDGACHSVVAAQAFHWFANPQALKEIHRVLAPDGRFGLIWNTADTSEPWVKTLMDYVATLFPEDIPRQTTKQWQKVFEDQCLFGPLHKHIMAMTMLVTPQATVDRILSLSVVSAMSEADKEAVAARVRDIIATHPDTAGKPQFNMPHQVEMYWTQKL